MRGSTGLAAAALLEVQRAVPTEDGSKVRMPELTRERSIVKVPLEFELLPPTGPPTPTGDVVVPDTFEKSELRSKLVSWSLPGMLDPGTVTGVGLTSSLLGVRVGVVSIWFITSGKEDLC